MIKADDVKLSEADNKFTSCTHYMLHSHRVLCDGRQEEINFAEHANKFKDNSKPFKWAFFPSRVKLFNKTNIQSRFVRATNTTSIRQFEALEAKKQLQVRDVEPAVSQSTAPVFFVSEKDGERHPFVSYCKLDEMILKGNHPSLLMQDCIYSLNQAKIVSILDVNSIYWQLHIREESRPKTTVVTHSDTYLYTRNPFRPSNAIVSLRPALDVVLTK